MSHKIPALPARAKDLQEQSRKTAATVNQILEHLSNLEEGGSNPVTVPIGTGPVATVRATAPNGWLLMYGQTMGNAASGATEASEEYAELYDYVKALPPNVGTEVFASGTAVTIPDLRGRLPLGKDNMGGASANRVTDAAADEVGSAAGSATHTLIAAEMPAHTHGLAQSGAITVTGSGAGGANGSRGIITATDSAGSDAAHTIMQPYLTVNYMIKY